MRHSFKESLNSVYHLGRARKLPFQGANQLPRLGMVRTTTPVREGEQNGGAGGKIMSSFEQNMEKFPTFVHN